MIILGKYSENLHTQEFKDDIVIEETSKQEMYLDKETKERKYRDLHPNEMPISVKGFLTALHITKKDIPVNFCILQIGWDNGRIYELFLENHKIAFNSERTALE